MTTDVHVDAAAPALPTSQKARGEETARHPRTKAVAWGAVLLLLSLALTWASLLLGTPRFGSGEVADLLRSSANTNAVFVVQDLRLPRALGALVIGALLGLSGTLLQDSLRNPLASPDLLGVTIGGSVVVAFVVAFGIGVSRELLPALSLLGGLGVGFGVLLVARRTEDTVRLLLVGAALSAMLSALVISIVALINVDGRLIALFRYLSGSMSTFGWAELEALAPWAAVGVPLALVSGRILNIMAIGDDHAAALGIKVRRTRLRIFALAVILVAPVVAYAGPIAFVALLGPHVARRLVRTSDARLILPLSALAGMVLLLAADLPARVILAPREIPVGILTAAVGGPILLLLLRRDMRRMS